MADEPLFSEWRTYEKVVSHDYMHHAVYFHDLGVELAARFQQPVHVLDLGCGDARPVTGLLKRLPVARYVGIDESAEALRCAGLVLEGRDFPVTLHTGDMQQSIDIIEGGFDLAIASYSLHHLQPADKQILLAKCHTLMKPGGAFAVIDVFLQPGESRAAYIDRWQEHARHQFTALAAEELSTLLDHVATRDLPESVATYRTLALEAGFRSVEVLRTGPEQLNRLMLLT